MRALRALWSVLRVALYPEGTWSADSRRALEHEAWESNARVARWVALVAAPVNTIPVVVLFLRPDEGSAGAGWVFWLAGVNTLSAAASILMGIVAWRRRPEVVWRVLGDVMGVLCLVGSAVRSANAQRAHPNINIFIVGALAAAFFLRMRSKVFVSALAVAGALLLGAIVGFRQDGWPRVADELSLFATCSLALFGFFIARGMRVRELLARRQVQLLNAELERRVEAQVHEIVGRAREIEELNTQLNEKISERSRELSKALARLAGGHTPLGSGTVLGGRVELEAEIGHGGMGIVYRGRDLVTNKTVAVKVVQAGSANELDDLHRFLREARAMASVTHGAIVRSIHVDVSEDGRLFQMMELVEGETLESRLASSVSLPPLVASRLGAVLAEALAAAHAAGVIHRDVKPSNVMLTRTAPGLKLLDFGISKLWDTRESNSHTHGQLLGTPQFLSPEQVNAPANVGAPADVYALGLVLYLCVAGCMPFEADTPRRWLMMHILETPMELSTRLPDVDPTLASTVMACLHKDPKQRPTASAVADALSRIADAAGTPPLEAYEPVRAPVAVRGTAYSSSAVTEKR